MSNLQDLPNIITAVAGLGTAAFGLVDSTKVFAGGVNRIGFSQIEKLISSLTPGTQVNALEQSKIIETLRANWYNGQDLTKQKAVAKSLIKLGLNAANAAAVAKATGVDEATLQSAVAKMAAGTSLAPTESDVYARFDVILTAMLDHIYQDSDQRYVNGTRVTAGIFAVLLAFAGGWIANGGAFHIYAHSPDLWRALLAGVLATPLAPVAKDLTSALSTAVNTMQSIKKAVQ